MSISDYTIGVGPYTGSGPVHALSFYESWTLDKNLDDGCTFSFYVPGYAPETAAISELDTDVWLYRNGSLNQRFRIIEVDQTWGSSGEDTVRVQAVCYRRLLGSRYIQSRLRFDQISQGNIIWGLIQHTQSQPYGNLGISLGAAGPSVLRDREYEAGENILDVITNLTQVIGGPTWDINQNLELIVSRQDLYPSNPTPIVLGATARSLQRPSGASLFANSVLVTGNTETTVAVSQDSTSLNTDPRGRWERRESFPSVELQQTLNDHASGLLSNYQSPTAIWKIGVVPERYFDDAKYRLGDFIEIVQPSSTAAPIGIPAVRILGQVLAIEVKQDADGGIEVNLKVLDLGPAI